MADTGTVVTYTVIRVAPPDFGGHVPYVVAVLEMDDSTRIMAQVVDVESEDMSIGMKVRLEFRKIRMHPLLGLKKLAHREDLIEGQLMMAYQHDERLDGKGYPVGCVETDIHPWAKLCAVVDVFEALTSQRPYRTPMPRSKALMLQQRDSGAAFDPEMLACWKSIIQRNLAS